MSELWLQLKDLPTEGRELSVDDPAVWAGPCAACGMECGVRTPLKALVQLLPQEQGLLVRGILEGEVALPCDRCAEPAPVVVAQRFDEFEPFPAERKRNTKRKAPEAELFDEESSTLMRETKAGLEFDLGGFLWEQFLLALPVKPLCTDACKGLCPVCGQNCNQGRCGCATEDKDPRLAALRGLRLS